MVEGTGKIGGWEGNREEFTAVCCLGPRVSNANWRVNCKVYLECFQRFWFYESAKSLAVDGQCWKRDGLGGIEAF